MSRRRVHLQLDGVSTSPERIEAERPPSAEDRLWIADLALVPSDEGPLSLGVVLDVYSHRCLGWWPRAELDPVLITHALQLAMARRRTRPGAEPVALVLARRCHGAGVEVPSWARASGAELAISRAFFGALREDLVGPAAWPTRAAAAAAISGWITSAYNLGETSSGWPETTALGPAAKPLEAFG